MVSQVAAAPVPSAAQHPLYKTVWCKNVEERGFCPYQDACTFAHSEDEKRDPPYAMNEQPTPSPGPMTIDMGSLFSSARRVKGVRPRGGMSGSSAQLAGKDSRDISESQTGSTPSGANIDKQPVASQPVEQAPRSVAAGRPQPSWSKAQRAEAASSGHARVPGSPAPTLNPANSFDADKSGAHDGGEAQADASNHLPAMSARKRPDLELANGASSALLATPSPSLQSSNPPPTPPQPSSTSQPPSQKPIAHQHPQGRVPYMPPPTQLSHMLPTPQPVHGRPAPPPPTPPSPKQSPPQAAQGVAAPTPSLLSGLEHATSQPHQATGPPPAPPTLTTAPLAPTALPHIALHPSGADAGVHPDLLDPLPPMPSQQLLSPRPASQSLPPAQQPSPAGPRPLEASSPQQLPSQLPQLAMMSQTIRSQQELAQTLERTNQKLTQDNQKLEKDYQTLKKDNQKLRKEKQELEVHNQHQKQGLQRLLSDKRRLQDILKAVRLPQVFLLDLDDGYIEEDWEAAVNHKLQAARAHASSQRAIAHLVINHGGEDKGRSAAIRILCNANQKYSGVATASHGFEGGSGDASILAVIFPPPHETNAGTFA